MNYYHNIHSPPTILHLAVNTIQNYMHVEGHSIEVHNSRRPFDHLTVYDYRRECKGTATLFQYLAASSNAFTLCDPVTLTFDIF